MYRTTPILLMRLAMVLSTCVVVPAAIADDWPKLQDRVVHTKTDVAVSRDAMSNPKIDMSGYLAVSQEAAIHRAQRRLGEAEFLSASREPGTIILDARSKEKYDLLHVKGAVNLSFPDITVASLAQVLPDKNARILIYCNNNFTNEEQAFPTKMARASLNLSTYIALYSYGYRNIYELGPLLDIAASQLPFESAAPRHTALRTR